VQIKTLEGTRLIETNNWIARIRPPEGQWNGRLVLLLHGWTGDENISWIFAHKVPRDCWVVSPRGLLKSPEGGYAWAIPTNGRRPDISPFLDKAARIVEQLPAWVPGFTLRNRLDVVGFSQGGAMTYAMCLVTNPTKAAPLAGYLPPRFVEHLSGKNFSDLQMFIAHNTDDEMVPIEESRRAARLFEEQGASVKFCESTGGHKLSSTCFNNLNAFLRD
jgi:predicted esterase